jgi:ubiquinone/menaquinone biosynthesis C-methylase UbiE
MKITEQHQSNRAAWNEAAGQYKHDFEKSVAFLKDGGKNFIAPELDFIGDLKDWCQRAIHLQCAAGHDTLSLWNLGAKEVVGVDISDEMIGLARAKTEKLGAPATWHRCDLLSTPAELNNTADLVYTGRGALNWQMDIEAWATVAARLLKPGGKLYVFEGHPFMWVWDLEATEYKLDPEYGNYFDNAPHVDQGWPEQYIDKSVVVPQEEQAQKYERQWTVAQIINAIIGAGLTIEKIGEHPDPYWPAFPNMPAEMLKRLPQTISILARK